MKYVFGLAVVAVSVLAIESTAFADDLMSTSVPANLKKVNAELVSQGSIPFVIDPVIVADANGKKTTTITSADQLSCISTEIQAFRAAEQANSIDKATGKRILKYIGSGPIHIQLMDTTADAGAGSEVYLNGYGNDYLRKYGDDLQKHLKRHVPAKVQIQLKVDPATHQLECSAYSSDVLTQYVKDNWLNPLRAKNVKADDVATASQANGPCQPYGPGYAWNGVQCVPTNSNQMYGNPCAVYGPEYQPVQTPQGIACSYIGAGYGYNNGYGYVPANSGAAQ